MFPFACAVRRASSARPKTSIIDIVSRLGRGDSATETDSGRQAPVYGHAASQAPRRDVEHRSTSKEAFPEFDLSDADIDGQVWSEVLRAER